jgi:hypothetical protein
MGQTILLTYLNRLKGARVRIIASVIFYSAHQLVVERSYLLIIYTLRLASLHIKFRVILKLFYAIHPFCK